MVRSSLRMPFPRLPMLTSGCRQIIYYPVCAVLILLAAVLDDPGGSEAASNVEAIGQFTRFMQYFQSREGCNLKNLIDMCSKLYDIASSAKDNPDYQTSGEKSSPAEQWQQHRVCSRKCWKWLVLIVTGHVRAFARLFRLHASRTWAFDEYAIAAC